MWRLWNTINCKTIVQVETEYKKRQIDQSYVTKIHMFDDFVQVCKSRGDISQKNYDERINKITKIESKIT